MLDEFVIVTSRRAAPLPPQERRTQILDSVLPLLIERGRGVSSRELADCAGVAEGTIFRAFGDKEALIQAAAERYLDPVPLDNGLRTIDPEDPLELKTAQVVRLLRERFRHVYRFMVAMGEQPERPGPGPRGEFAELMTRIFAPDADRLPVSPERIGHYLRILVFASTIPSLAEGPAFTDDELTELVLNGIVGKEL